MSALPGVRRGVSAPARAGALVVRFLAVVTVLALVMIGLGLLITRVLEDGPVLAGEDDLEREYVGWRTPAWTRVSAVASFIGNTSSIVVVMFVVGLLLRWAYGRWRETGVVVLAVTTQATVFFVTSELVDRERPEVVKLDDSPPTASFPSGHTGAAVALYLSIAVVLAWNTRRAPVRRLIVLALVTVPVAVALGRLYRGMHHPTDVAGAFLNGGLSVAAWTRSLLPWRDRRVARPDG